MCFGVRASLRFRREVYDLQSLVWFLLWRVCLIIVSDVSLPYFKAGIGVVAVRGVSYDLRSSVRC